jgi:hypothetical protein
MGTVSLQLDISGYLGSSSCPPHSQVQISLNILEAEQTLQNQLPEGSKTTTLSSWIQIIQASIQVLNSTSPINDTHCFLCASLQCPLLAPVPINFFKPTLTSIPDTPTCYTPLPSIPLWEPEPDQHPLPSYLLLHSTFHPQGGTTWPLPL